jgi:transcriptional regulator with XRE-family HTH domain
MRQQDLAAALGVAVSTVANWERGQSYPERHLGAVEAALGITLTDDGDRAPVVYDDPEEALIWSWTDLTEADRTDKITELRAVRRAAARAARPTGTD